MKEHLLKYVLRLGDDSLILGQRLAEWCGHGPILEEDIALTNISLDLIGQATSFLNYAGELEGKGRSGDDFAFLRIEKEYLNCLLVEQLNGHFGDTMLRQFFFDAFRKNLFEALLLSSNKQLAAIAEKSLKETRYHLKHSSEWLIRLGDGTEESNLKMQDSLNTLWRYTDELFFEDEVDSYLRENKVIPDLRHLKVVWKEYVDAILLQAKLEIPTNNWQFQGGRLGKHSEHMGFLLAELQYMQRTYPNMEW